ncbi:MAG: cyclic nucleotide-binding domain-containing protein [Bacteroidota bacterium]
MVRTNVDLLAYMERLVISKNLKVVQETRKRDDLLIKQNSVVNTVFIVKQGLVKCYLTEESGKDFIQEFFGPGELFGEIEVFHRKLSFCAIEAITPLEVFKITHRDFVHLLENDKEFNRHILTSLVSKVYYKGQRHSYNQNHTIKDKMEKFEIEFPEWRKLISKKDVANYFGITERSLNRVLSDR